MLASDCLAGGGGANDYGAWLTASVRVRRVAESIARAVTNFLTFVSELSPFSLLRFLRKNAAKKEEVPGLGGKEELRVQYPSGANRYPSTVTECRAVTSPRLHTTEQWQEAVSEFICILFYTTKKKES